MKKYLIFIAILVWLAACAPAKQAAEPAQQALVDFFNYLSKGQYEQASEVYGGTYETLTGMNPDIDPGDLVALWEAGCQFNGLRCLPVRSAALKEQSGDTFIFTVEFSNPDGSLFVLGPCCGATETEMPSVSQFEFTVQKTPQGQFKVLTLPVYVP